MQTTAGQSYAFSLSYYPFMGVKSVTYPNSNRTITVGYDNFGRANTLTGQITGNTPTNCVTGTNYAPHGAISSLALGNALTETRQYNARLQPTQIQLGNLLTITNRYDPNSGADVDCSGHPVTVAGNNGNVLAQTVNGLARAYSYDGVNRLCRAAQGSTWAQAYGYDTLGNLAVTGSGQLPSATAESNGGLYGSNNRVTTWAYDRAGNQTGIPAAMGSTVRAGCATNTMAGVAMARTACYDAENRMESETDANGAASTYTYDGDGRRVSKTSGGFTTTFVYDPLGQLAQEYGGAPIPGSESGTRYLTTDHLGSTRLLTKGDGTLAQTYDYPPFGQEFTMSGDPNRLRFTSKERDAETGLDWFSFRYMSSAQGRWTSPDQPFADQHIEDPQSWNMYAYVRNNPLAHVDPNGQQSCAINMSACGYSPSGPPTARDAAIAAAPEIGAGAGLFGTLRAAGSAALAWMLGHPQQVQDAAAGIAEGLSGAAPGSLSSASTLSTFGFTKVEGAIEGFTYGRLANGAEIAAQFTKAGDNLTASVLGAFNAGGNKEVAGTLGSIVQGAQAVAKAQVH